MLVALLQCGDGFSELDVRLVQVRDALIEQTPRFSILDFIAVSSKLLGMLLVVMAKVFEKLNRLGFWLRRCFRMVVTMLSVTMAVRMLVFLSGYMVESDLRVTHLDPLINYRSGPAVARVRFPPHFGRCSSASSKPVCLRTIRSGIPRPSRAGDSPIS